MSCLVTCRSIAWHMNYQWHLGLSLLAIRSALHAPLLCSSAPSATKLSRAGTVQSQPHQALLQHSAPFTHADLSPFAGMSFITATRGSALL